MLLRLRFLAAITSVVVAMLAAIPGWSQSSASGIVLNATAAAKLLPVSVFFKDQSAPIQARNSGGIKFGDGSLTLATLVDNSGYSTSVQQKYQTYLITEGAILINGKPLAPGAYGAGFISGKFGVMDIGGHDILSVDANHDSALKRPTPLQFIADDTAGQIRLYQGRDYVVITAHPQ